LSFHLACQVIVVYPVFARVAVARSFIIFIVHC